MKFGAKGMSLLREFEGYHTKLPDGSCIAYLDTLARPAVWTIGYGLTEGVYQGMKLTAAEAEACLRKELAGHEAAVVRLVTVDLNQHQFDALVSFSYNVGWGALGRSTLLKRLNAGDYDGAAREFARWNKAGGKVWRGLVRRRAAEAALFLEPVEPGSEPAMPQIVEESTPRPVAHPVRDSTAGAVVATGSVSLVQPWTWPWNEWLLSLGCNTGIECASALGSYASKPMAMISMVMIVGAVWMARRAKA